MMTISQEAVHWQKKCAKYILHRSADTNYEFTQVEDGEVFMAGYGGPKCQDTDFEFLRWGGISS